MIFAEFTMFSSRVKSVTSSITLVVSTTKSLGVSLTGEDERDFSSEFLTLEQLTSTTIS